MAKTTGLRLVISAVAQQDVRDVGHWSTATFGISAAARYRNLIRQAFRDVEENPFRPGSLVRPELSQNIRTYHLALSRSRVEGQRVKAPRHLVVYSVDSSKTVILRVLHEKRDLERHLTEIHQA